MDIQKIYVNDSNDYKIWYNGRWVGPRNKATIFSEGQDLTGIVNPVIIDALPDATIVSYMPPPEPTLQQLKNRKIGRIRDEAETDLEFNGVVISFCDLQRLAPVLIGSDTEIEARLPIETTTDFVIDTVDKVKAVKDLYANQVLTAQKRITDCRKAETKEELDSI